MDKPEISVIVPVYKVEKFIDRCINSILVQTYSEFELLLIDDGSPDNSGNICEKYSLLDTRVKVFHKKNGGLSDARNFGVNFAKGKYVTFIDSDDYITKDYLYTLYSLSCQNNADIVVGNYQVVTDSDILPKESDTDESFKVNTFSGDEALLKMLDSKMYIQFETAWGKLIKTDIVKRYPFPVGRLREDEATTFYYYLNAEKVIVTSKILYGYYNNSSSIMRTDNNEKRLEDGLWAVTLRAKTLDDLGKKEIAPYAWHFVYGWLLEDVLVNTSRRWRWKEYYLSIQKAKYVIDGIKYKSFLYMWFPYIFKSLQKMRGKG